MLRPLALFLFLVNSVYFAWSNGLLSVYGFEPSQQREPQRIEQQIDPEVLHILSATEFKRVEAQVRADLAPKECLQAGPFDDEQAATLRRTLEATLSPNLWQLDTVPIPARWIVYIGRFATEEGLAKKRAELLALDLSSQTPNNPDLQPGLSLGGYDNQKTANAELARLHQRGIRTARVVLERAEGHSILLKLPTVSEALKPQLNAVKPALFGKALRSCN